MIKVKLKIKHNNTRINFNKIENSIKKSKIAAIAEWS